MDALLVKCMNYQAFYKPIIKQKLIIPFLVTKYYNHALLCIILGFLLSQDLNLGPRLRWPNRLNGYFLQTSICHF